MKCDLKINHADLFSEHIANFCICVVERTRCHRHTACQQTGRERADQEEANRPEPRIQEKHTRGEKIRFLWTHNSIQPHHIVILLTALLRLCLLSASLRKCSSDYLLRKQGSRQRTDASLSPKIVPPLVSLKS